MIPVFEFEKTNRDDDLFCNMYKNISFLGFAKHPKIVYIVTKHSVTIATIKKLLCCNEKNLYSCKTIQN